jgi:hypothetical protein
MRCGFSENRKDNVIRHLQRKKECECLYSSISRKECINILKTGDYKSMVNLLLEELKKTKQNVISNNSGQIAIGDHASVNNHNTTYNIEIKINSFEKTDYSVLKDKIHTCIKEGKVDEAKLIQILHFNKDVPQNHNVMIDNKRDKTIKVYNGKEFEDSEYSGREGIWNFSKDVVDKTEQSLGEEIQSNVEELKRQEKTQKINKIQQQLYNNRNMIKDTHTKCVTKNTL